MITGDIFMLSVILAAESDRQRVPKKIC